jgi:hypothetical protein
MEQSLLRTLKSLPTKFYHKNNVSLMDQPPLFVTTIKTPEEGDVMNFQTYMANRNLLLKNMDIIKNIPDDLSKVLISTYDLNNTGTATEPDIHHDPAMNSFLKAFDEKQKKMEQERQLAQERERMTALLQPLIEKLSKQYIDTLLITMGNRFKELEHKHKDLEDLFYDEFGKKR